MLPAHAGVVREYVSAAASAVTMNMPLVPVVREPSQKKLDLFVAYCRFIRSSVGVPPLTTGPD
ncbi:hypothetical protein Val02_47120 [Virgisporangium aliadipatigenens]|uniref:Uncharacterized protein n=1 Tax=Virgisporangium aliadipatigenens TaxID=741659 RepID=A0A8J3YQ32_9ACTN|nr:hypothetical protein Val02_47120 [Virgisporangium aliadipatigenens]